MPPVFILWAAVIVIGGGAYWIAHLHEMRRCGESRVDGESACVPGSLPQQA
jgi:hypothetical protein